MLFRSRPAALQTTGASCRRSSPTLRIPFRRARGCGARSGRRRRSESPGRRDLGRGGSRRACPFVRGTALSGLYEVVSPSSRSRRGERTLEPTKVPRHAPLLDEELRHQRLSESTRRLRGTLVRAQHAFREQRVEREEPKAGSRADGLCECRKFSEVQGGRGATHWKKCRFGSRGPGSRI